MQGYRAVIDALSEGSSPIPPKAVWRTSEEEARQDGARLLQAAGGLGEFRIETAEVDLFEFSWRATNGAKLVVDEAHLSLALTLSIEIQFAAVFLQFQETGEIINKDTIRIAEISRRRS
jgi:hypothetical protein